MRTRRSGYIKYALGNFCSRLFPFPILLLTPFCEIHPRTVVLYFLGTVLCLTRDINLLTHDTHNSRKTGIVSWFNRDFAVLLIPLQTMRTIVRTFLKVRTQAARNAKHVDAAASRGGLFVLGVEDFTDFGTELDLVPEARGEQQLSRLDERLDSIGSAGQQT